jgi:hypothetical protein
MANSNAGLYGKVISEFSLHSLNRRAFDAFFQLCCHHSIGYLRYLKSRGFQLPLDYKVGRDPIPDLAFDILGFFLSSPKEQLFAVIFDCVKRTEIADPRQVDPGTLYHTFAACLLGFIRKWVQTNGAGKPTNRPSEATIQGFSERP